MPSMKSRVEAVMDRVSCGFIGSVTDMPSRLILFMVRRVPFMVDSPSLPPYICTPGWYAASKRGLRSKSGRVSSSRLENAPEYSESLDLGDSRKPVSSATAETSKRKLSCTVPGISKKMLRSITSLYSFALTETTYCPGCNAKKI
jgi:hypothetical protein